MKYRLTVFLILVLAFLMRFYHFAALIHWTMDEDLWSYIPYNIATGYHFPLIGGHIAGTGLYSGPLFVYLMAIPAYISAGNPLGFTVTTTLLGILTTWLIIHIGSEMFGRRAGLLSGLIYAGSFLMVIFDRHYWNASLTPLLSLLTVGLIYAIIREKKYHYTVLLALVLALAFHAHGTGMALLLFTILSWLVFRIPLRKKAVVVAIIIFLVLQTPLVFFDLRHGYTNSRAIVAYVTTNKGGSMSVPNRIKNVVTGLSSAGAKLIYWPAKDLALEQTLGLEQKYVSLKAKPPWFSTVIFLLIVVSGFLRLRKSLGVRVLMLLAGATMAGLLIYKDILPEYYFSTIFIPICLLGGFLIRRRLWMVVFFLLVLNIFVAATVRHSFGYQERLAQVKTAINLTNGQPFSVFVDGQGGWGKYGLRYMFTYLRREPVKSYMDNDFDWLYDRRLEKVPARREIHFLINGENTIIIAKRPSDRGNGN